MKGLLICALMLMGSACFAAEGLVLHTAEFGVGKFHRYDNKVHAYGNNHAWAPFIIAESAKDLQTVTQKNADGSYSIFFASLEDMLKAAVQISKAEGKKISVVNVHGHGLPGAMWFPKDGAALQSWACGDWKSAAEGADVENYSQYYSPVSVSDIEQIRDMSNSSSIHMPCTTGLREWQDVAGRMPEFKAALADSVQMHFVSCVVGLGTAGENFTKGIAALLVGETGRVETSMNFGLGDWSMPAGMGFWDYQTVDQVNHDNSLYTKNHRDADIAQKGTIRMVSKVGKDWNSSLLAGRDVMSLAFETTTKGVLVPEPVATRSMRPLPTRVRIPGTTAYVSVEQE